MQYNADGSLVGQAGVKYGLQLSGAALKQKQAAAAGRKPAAARPVARKGAAASVFGDDDDSDEDVEAQVARQADKKRSAAKVGGTALPAHKRVYTVWCAPIISPPQG